MLFDKVSEDIQDRGIQFRVYIRQLMGPLTNPAKLACRSHVMAFAFTYGLIKRL